jgi:hypothetical protein
MRGGICAANLAPPLCIIAVDAFGTAIMIALCSERTKSEKQTYTCVETKTIVPSPRECLLVFRRVDHLMSIWITLFVEKVWTGALCPDP